MKCEKCGEAFETTKASRRFCSERCRKAVERRRLMVKTLKMVSELKDKPCLDCGGRFPAVAMDFDHRDSNTKTGEVSRLIRQQVGEAKIRAEIAKCDLVCANCHRVRTAKNLGWAGYKIST